MVRNPGVEPNQLHDSIASANENGPPNHPGIQLSQWHREASDQLRDEPKQMGLGMPHLCYPGP